MDFKLELVLIPVSDVDRAKAFYTEKLGWSLDVDHQPSDTFRVVQMTPPGRPARSPSASGSRRQRPGRTAGRTSSSTTSTPRARSWSREASR